MQLQADFELTDEQLDALPALSEVDLIPQSDSHLIMHTAMAPFTYHPHKLFVGEIDKARFYSYLSRTARGKRYKIEIAGVDSKSENYCEPWDATYYGSLKDLAYPFNEFLGTARFVAVVRWYFLLGFRVNQFQEDPGFALTASWRKDLQGACNELIAATERENKQTRAEVRMDQAKGDMQVAKPSKTALTRAMARAKRDLEFSSTHKDLELEITDHVEDAGDNLEPNQRPDFRRPFSPRLRPQRDRPSRSPLPTTSITGYEDILLSHHRTSEGPHSPDRHGRNFEPRQGHIPHEDLLSQRLHLPRLSGEPIETMDIASKVPIYTAKTRRERRREDLLEANRTENRLTSRGTATMNGESKRRARGIGGVSDKRTVLFDGAADDHLPYATEDEAMEEDATMAERPNHDSPNDRALLDYTKLFRQRQRIQERMDAIERSLTEDEFQVVVKRLETDG